jgi:hypothetical protein
VLPDTMRHGLPLPQTFQVNTGFWQSLNIKRKLSLGHATLKILLFVVVILFFEC